jgi:hypothetical protein
MQFHNPERQLVSLCEIQKTNPNQNPKTQKCHAARETDRNSSAGCSRFPLIYLLSSLSQRTSVCMAFLASVAFLARRAPNRGSFKLGSEYLGSA